MPEDTEEPVKKSRWLTIVLSLVPVWLAVSAGVAVWWALRDDDQEEIERQQRFAIQMSEERITEDLRKLREMVGERHTRDESSQRNLTRAAAMVEGILGPSNTGYQVDRIVAPNEWPIFRVSLPAAKDDAPQLWVVAAYDSPRDTDTSLADSALASVIATAQALAKDQLESTLHFLFVPHGNESESPIADTLKKAQTLMDAPASVFVIGPMGSSPQLICLASDTAAPSVRALGELGGQERLGSEIQNLATTYQTLNLPVLWVTTRRDGSDPNAIEASNIAVSAGKLVEWLRRAARLEAAE